MDVFGTDEYDLVQEMWEDMSFGSRRWIDTNIEDLEQDNCIET